MTQFVYLGSTLIFLLDDTVGVKCRILKALKAMGALKSIWEAKEVPLIAKRKLYKAIPVNLILWESENWSGNWNDLKLMEAFYYKAIHRILGISMKRVMEEETKNSIVRE